MKIHLLSICAALLLLPTTALAAPGEKASRNDEGASVSERDGNVREVIFDTSDTVDGEVLAPNGVQVGGDIAKAHASMIGIRGQFTNQLIWLSNDI
jgi:hypothetical protein